MRIFRNLRDDLYDSLDTLKILTFWDILRTDNKNLLDKDYHKEKKYTNKQIETIDLLWQRLFDDYFMLREDSTAKSNLVKSFDELRLHEKIKQVNDAIDFLILLNGYIDILPSDDFLKYEQEIYVVAMKIDKRIKPKLFDGIYANVEYLGKVLKSFINQYNIDFKKNEKIIKKEIDNVYEMVANAESWIERSLNINEMVVSHWLAIEKQVILRQKSLKKNGTR